MKDLAQDGYLHKLQPELTKKITARKIFEYSIFRGEPEDCGIPTSSKKKIILYNIVDDGHSSDFEYCSTKE